MKPSWVTLFTAFTFGLQHAAEAQTDSTNLNTRIRRSTNHSSSIIFLLNDHGQNPAIAAHNGSPGFATFGEVTTLNNALLGYTAYSGISLASNPHTRRSNFSVSHRYTSAGFYGLRVLGFAYAPRFRINRKSTLTAALEFQVFKLNFNRAHATFPDMVSPDTPGFVSPSKLPPHQTVIAPMFTFGMLYEHTNLVVQGVISNLTESNVGSYKTPGEAASFPRVFSAAAAYRVAINNHFACMPSLQFRYNNQLLQAAETRSIETGTDVFLLKNRKLSVGALWNSSHAYTLRTGYFDVSGFRFQLAYIYRYKLSETLNAPHRTFQININYVVIPRRWSKPHAEF